MPSAGETIRTMPARFSSESTSRGGGNGNPIEVAFTRPAAGPGCTRAAGIGPLGSGVGVGVAVGMGVGVVVSTITSVVAGGGSKFAPAAEIAAAVAPSRTAPPTSAATRVRQRSLEIESGSEEMVTETPWIPLGRLSVDRA
jgi:hypothetical protein